MVVLASIPERAEAPCEVPARLLLLVFTALPVVGKLAGVAESAVPILKVPAQPPLLLRLGADARDRGGGRGSAGRRQWKGLEISILESGYIALFELFVITCSLHVITCSLRRQQLESCAAGRRVRHCPPAPRRGRRCLARSHRLFLHRLHALSVPRRRLCSSVSLTHSSFTDAGWQEPLGPEVTCDWMATGHVNIDDDLPALVREHETPNEREKEQWIFPVASSCNYVARG